MEHNTIEKVSNDTKLTQEENKDEPMGARSQSVACRSSAVCRSEAEEKLDINSKRLLEETRKFLRLDSNPLIEVKQDEFLNNVEAIDKYKDISPLHNYLSKSLDRKTIDSIKTYKEAEKNNSSNNLIKSGTKGLLNINNQGIIELKGNETISEDQDNIYIDDITIPKTITEKYSLEERYTEKELEFKRENNPQYRAMTDEEWMREIKEVREHHYALNKSYSRMMQVLRAPIPEELRKEIDYLEPMGIGEYSYMTAFIKNREPILERAVNKINAGEAITVEEAETLNAVKYIYYSMERRGVSLGAEVFTGVKELTKENLLSTLAMVSTDIAINAALTAATGLTGGAAAPLLATRVGMQAIKYSRMFNKFVKAHKALRYGAKAIKYVGIHTTSAGVDTMLKTYIFDKTPGLGTTKEERIRNKKLNRVLGFTDKGEMVIGRLSQDMENFLEYQDNVEQYNENLTERIIDPMVDMAIAALPIPRSIGNSFVVRGLKRINRIPRIAGTSFSGLATEHLEETAGMALNYMMKANDPETTLAQSIKEYYEPRNFALNTLNIMISGGLVHGVSNSITGNPSGRETESINRTVLKNYFKKRFEDNPELTATDKHNFGIDKYNYESVIDNLSESYVDNIAKKIFETEDRQSQERYYDKLDTIKQNLIDADVNEQEANNLMKIYDAVYSQSALNYGVSRYDIANRMELEFRMNEDGNKVDGMSGVEYAQASYKSPETNIKDFVNKTNNKINSGEKIEKQSYFVLDDKNNIRVNTDTLQHTNKHNLTAEDWEDIGNSLNNIVDYQFSTRNSHYGNKSIILEIKGNKNNYGIIITGDNFNYIKTAFKKENNNLWNDWWGKNNGWSARGSFHTITSTKDVASISDLIIQAKDYFVNKNNNEVYNQTINNQTIIDLTKEFNHIKNNTEENIQKEILKLLNQLKGQDFTTMDGNILAIDDRGINHIDYKNNQQQPQQRLRTNAAIKRLKDVLTRAYKVETREVNKESVKHNSERSQNWKLKNIESINVYETPIKIGDKIYYVNLITERYKKEPDIDLFSVNQVPAKDYTNKKFKNQRENKASDKDYLYEIYLKNKSSELRPVFGSFTRRNNYNQTNSKSQQEIKGRSIFTDSKAVIELFRNKADQSTLLHESAHYFLKLVESFADNDYIVAKEQLKDIKEWTASEITKDPNLFMHERFARGFEQYIRSGKANNNYLKEVFDYFKGFLERIYKNADDLEIDLNNRQMFEFFDKYLYNPQNYSNWVYGNDGDDEFGKVDNEGGVNTYAGEGIINHPASFVGSPLTKGGFVSSTPLTPLTKGGDKKEYTKWGDKKEYTNWRDDLATLILNQDVETDEDLKKSIANRIKELTAEYTKDKTLNEAELEELTEQKLKLELTGEQIDLLLKAAEELSMQEAAVREKLLSRKQEIRDEYESIIADNIVGNVITELWREYTPEEIERGGYKDNLDRLNNELMERRILRDRRSIEKLNETEGVKSTEQPLSEGERTAKRSKDSLEKLALLTKYIDLREERQEQKRMAMSEEDIRDYYENAFTDRQRKLFENIFNVVDKLWAKNIKEKTDYENSVLKRVNEGRKTVMEEAERIGIEITNDMKPFKNVVEMLKDFERRTENKTHKQKQSDDKAGSRADKYGDSYNDYNITYDEYRNIVNFKQMAIKRALYELRDTIAEKHRVLEQAEKTRDKETDLRHRAEMEVEGLKERLQEEAKAREAFTETTGITVENLETILKESNILKDPETLNKILRLAKRHNGNIDYIKDKINENSRRENKKDIQNSINNVLQNAFHISVKTGKVYGNTIYEDSGLAQELKRINKLSMSRAKEELIKLEADRNSGINKDSEVHYELKKQLLYFKGTAAEELKLSDMVEILNGLGNYLAESEKIQAEIRKEKFYNTIAEQNAAINLIEDSKIEKGSLNLGGMIVGHLGNLPTLLEYVGGRELADRYDFIQPETLYRVGVKDKTDKIFKGIFNSILNKDGRVQKQAVDIVINSENASSAGPSVDKSTASRPDDSVIINDLIQFVKSDDEKYLLAQNNRKSKKDDSKNISNLFKKYNEEVAEIKVIKRDNEGNSFYMEGHLSEPIDKLIDSLRTEFEAKNDGDYTLTLDYLYNFAKQASRGGSRKNYKYKLSQYDFERLSSIIGESGYRNKNILADFKQKEYTKIKPYKLNTWNLMYHYLLSKNRETRGLIERYYPDDYKRLDEMVKKQSKEFFEIADILYNSVQDRDEINPYYRIDFNKDMGKIENYFPRVSFHEDEASLFDMLTSNQDRFQKITAIENRSRDAIPNLENNPLLLALKHIRQTEYTKSIAVPLKNMFNIFTSRNVRNIITEKKGSDIYNAMVEHLNGLKYSYQQAETNVEQLMNYMVGNWAKSVTNTPSVFLKQMTSFLPYAEGLDMSKYLLSYSQGWLNPKKVFDFMMENSPYIKARLNGNEYGELLDTLKNRDKESKVFNLLEKMNVSRVFKHTLTELGDIISVVYGGYARIQTQLKNGLTLTDAIKDFEKQTVETQQSDYSSLKPRASLKSGLVNRMFGMFMSQDGQYFQKTMRDFIRYFSGEDSRPDIHKRMVVYHLMLPAMMTMVSGIINSLYGKKDKEWWEYMQQYMLAVSLSFMPIGLLKQSVALDIAFNFNSRYELLMTINNMLGTLTGLPIGTYQRMFFGRYYNSPFDLYDTEETKRKKEKREKEE